MLYLQDSICSEISCSRCYWAYFFDPPIDHYNCLHANESIYSPPQFNVCSCFCEDTSFELSDDSSVRKARSA